MQVHKSGGTLDNTDAILQTPHFGNRYRLNWVVEGKECCIMEDDKWIECYCLTFDEDNPKTPYMMLYCGVNGLSFLPISKEIFDKIRNQ